MISITNLTKAFGGDTLFEGASFQLNAGSRYGLVGANGSGKSTFLKILSGDEVASDGIINMPRRARLGVLKQDHFQYEDVPIVQVAMMGKKDVWDALEERERLLAHMDGDFDSDRYADVEEFILHNDGYSLEPRAAEILEGLGIPTHVHKENLSVLSGGFKLRVLLAQVLASDPDILLLDEPTNHLDILTIRWLEKFLFAYKGCAVVISHDHRFLDNISTHILDVDYETILLYHGNYTQFEEQKAAERDRKEHEIEKREGEIAKHKEFIDRFKAKATKARQAQSKVKMIEKIVIERLPQTSRRYPTFKFSQRRPSGRQVLELEGISKSYGDHQVLNNVSLRVQRGDRLAILGPNGIGKSTLLKIAMGVVDADAGKVEWGYETWPGYFAQDHRELVDASDQSVEAWLWELVPSETIGFVRGKLAEVLFRGDDVYKQLRALSGGEAARLVMAKLSVARPNILVLDEPTNHLDLEAIEAFVEGLEAYDGTILFVSHDRWFVSRLANRILEITHSGIRDFEGSYEDYLARCGDDHLDADVVLARARQEKKKEAAKKVAGKPTPAQEKQAKALASRRDKLTAEIDKAEARVHAINEMFCNPGFFDKTAAAEVKKLEAEQKTLSARIDESMTEWAKIESELGELAPTPAVQ
jgi:ATPase subunit of ABC transporter with duplicated ATPase domains